MRGTWGQSFRAPAFSEIAALANVAIQPRNTLAGANGESYAVKCTGGKPVAGSIAADVNPTCDPALLYPGGITVDNAMGGALAVGMRSSPVGPETATNTGIGFEFTPTDFLRGLDVQATYYKVDIENVLQQFSATTDTLQRSGLPLYLYHAERRRRGEVPGYRQSARGLSGHRSQQRHHQQHPVDQRRRGSQSRLSQARRDRLQRPLRLGYER